MKAAEAIEILESFNTNVDKLANSHFMTRAKASGISMNLTTRTSTDLVWALEGERNPDFDADTAGRMSVSLSAPDEEAVDAALLMYCMFAQEGDHISLHPKTKGDVFEVYREPFISKTLAQGFQDFVSKILNTYATRPVFEVNGEQLTMERICDTVIHSTRAPLDQDKRHFYEAWTSAFGAEELVQAKFRTSLWAMISNLLELQKIVNATIDALKT